MEFSRQESRTHVPPHGQVLLLLHVQHNLQPVAHAALGGAQQLGSISARVKGVALPHPGEDLGGGQRTDISGGQQALSRGQREDPATSLLPGLYLALSLNTEARIFMPPACVLSRFSRVRLCNPMP